MVADPPVGTNQLVAAVALVDCWRAMIAIGKKMNFILVVVESIICESKVCGVRWNMDRKTDGR